MKKRALRNGLGKHGKTAVFLILAAFFLFDRVSPILVTGQHSLSKAVVLDCAIDQNIILLNSARRAIQPVSRILTTQTAFALFGFSGVRMTEGHKFLLQNYQLTIRSQDSFPIKLLI
ncbi:MAG: hypothetical protein LBV52_06485 [Spirochaetaceae bacterium]|jgi:hypothetical protein|nr:hypothetical protein [Spirochaetaceae bacterium]